jgi:threonine synthase
VLVEGKKTAGLEIAEQSAGFGGVPEWVAVSVGDGCTIAGIWKGLKQMRELGVVDRLPRLLAVQADQVNPLQYAMEHGALPKHTAGKTIADSIDVHVPRNWRKAVRAIEEAHGKLLTASDDAILDAMRLAGRHGMFAEPAAAAALAGVVAAIESKTIGPQERVLVMITGSGLKDTKNAIRAAGRPIAIEPKISAVEQALNKSRKGAKAQSV